MFFQTLLLIGAFVLGFAVIYRVAWEDSRRNRECIADCKKQIRKTAEVQEKIIFLESIRKAG